MVERIVELEMRLAFQDDTVQQLNSVAVDQAQRIENLERRLEQVLADLRALRGLLYADSAAETPPPHY
ncbi:MAG: SlyX family protein [Aquimonas sp.]|nr:SlyX family protein [Xanthomonadales bacterium]MCC6505727.1 SlyX family protein [Aquimonas sp.]